MMLGAALKAVDVLGLGEADALFARVSVGTPLLLGRSLRLVVCGIC